MLPRFASSSLPLYSAFFRGLTNFLSRLFHTQLSTSSFTLRVARIPRVYPDARVQILSFVKRYSESCNSLRPEFPSRLNASALHVSLSRTFERLAAGALDRKHELDSCVIAVPRIAVRGSAGERFEAVAHSTKALSVRSRIPSGVVRAFASV